MTDYDVKITGVSIISRPQRWSNGDTPIAFFTVDSRGFEIRGCTLIKRKTSGGLYPVMPRGQTDTGQRAVFCHDQQLLDTITSAAKRAFENIGGKL